MSDKLISANKLMEYINGSIEEMTKVGVAVDGEYLWGLINYAIEDAPTIDAEPVRHGKWLFEEYPDGYYHSKCSLCNSWFSEDAFLNPYKYCPNCGACMIKQGDITTEQGDITTKRLDIPTMDEVNDEAN